MQEYICSDTIYFCHMRLAIPHRVSEVINAVPGKQCLFMDRTINFVTTYTYTCVHLQQDNIVKPRAQPTVRTPARWLRRHVFFRGGGMGVRYVLSKVAALILEHAGRPQRLSDRRNFRCGLPAFFHSAQTRACTRAWHAPPRTVAVVI